MRWNPFAITPRIEVAALGKHPLFGDFIEWPDPRGGSLIREWKPVCHERLFPLFTARKNPDQHAANLTLAARSETHFHLARVVPSSDAAGRSLIPFIGAARGPANPIQHWFESILPLVVRNTCLLLGHSNRNEISEIWETFAHQIDDAWNRLNKQESRSQSSQNPIPAACPARYANDHRFASGLYRLMAWMPQHLAHAEANRPAPVTACCLLPFVTDSGSRSLYFWLTFLQEALPKQVTLSAAIDHPCSKIILASGFFPQHLFDCLGNPDEYGLFYHELPGFQPSGTFLGLLQRVRNLIAAGCLPTAADLQI